MVEYLGVDDAGLRIRVDGSEQLLPVDHVVICAGQEPNRALQAELQAAGISAQLIGGADVAQNSTPSAPSTRAAGSPPRFDLWMNGDGM